MNCVQDPAFANGFVELESSIGQHVWLNLAEVKVLNYLYEVTDLKLYEEIKDSYFANMDVDDYDKSHWAAQIYVKGNEILKDFGDISGHDWVTIYTSLDMPNDFFTIQDDDGEYSSIRVEEIELVVGTETDRYTDEQMENIHKIIRC